MIALLVFITIANAGIYAQGVAKQESTATLGYIWTSNFHDCEGKDSANYTRVAVDVSAADCSDTSLDAVVNQNLIVCEPNGKKTIISVQTLTQASYPAGADKIYIGLFLGTSGPLEGKYILYRVTHLLRDYMKKCSSVLGQSLIVSKSADLLISDKLSPNVLINPSGAYEEFKKGCTTVCKGQEIGV